VRTDLASGLFMLNPPADPSTDTQAHERQTVANMLRALQGSGIKKVVAQSTRGWTNKAGIRQQPSRSYASSGSPSVEIGSRVLKGDRSRSSLLFCFEL
jgi:hypothetical protein